MRDNYEKWNQLYLPNGIIIILTLLVLFFSGIAGCGLTDSDAPDDIGEDNRQWYKGNLHTHSYWSNGDDYPEMIIDWYKSHGYDFLALSEHNTLAEGERWIEVGKQASGETVFQEYLNEFGEEWVEYEEKDNLYEVRLKTLEEYRSQFEEPEEFLIIKSEEIHDNYQGIPVHVNATNIQEVIEPLGGNSVLEVLQNNIDAVLQQGERLDVSIIPHVNHPNIGWAVTTEDFKQLHGVHFFEVYSGHPNARNSGNSQHPGTEQMWDEVNTYNVHNNIPLLYGLAVDDAHNYHTFTSDLSNPGRGWIQVKSSELSIDSLITALQRGSFYASTGVRLSNIQFDGKILSIKIDQEEGVRYTTKFIGTWKDQPQNPGMVLAEKEGIEPSYTFTGNELFVRAKIVSDKPMENPVRSGETEAAWVQPKMMR